jgi:hypothetical protein
MPDAMPLGETFFVARVRAIVVGLLVNKPRGGCVESVVTFATHRLFFPVDIQSVLVVFEVLHRPFVRLSCLSCTKCAQVLALAGFRVLFTGVQTILTGFQLPNHRKVLSVLIFSEGIHFAFLVRLLVVRLLVRLALTAEL